MSRASGWAMAAWLECVIVLASGRVIAAERVVFCEAQIEACAGAKRLGQAPPRGWWATMDDQLLVAAARSGRPIPVILYESASDYERAVAGLRSNDVREVILRRLDTERRTAIGAATGCLFGVIREDMLNVIRAAGPPDQAVVDGVLAAEVAFGGGEDRFKYLPPDATIDEASEEVAKVLAQLKPGPVAAGYAREAQRLTALLARFRPDGARGMPAVSPERAYFAPDERPPARIDGELFASQPWYAWRGGTVLVLRPDEAAGPQWSKSKLHLMYLDGATFYGDITSLTKAQMDRQLAARLKGPPAEELAQLVTRLAFDHAVFMREAAAVKTAKPPAPAEWAEVVALSTDNLRLAIKPAGQEAAPNLKTALAQLRADVAVVGVLVHASAIPSPGAPLVDRFLAALDKLPK
jgi:hypothetical protein